MAEIQSNAEYVDREFDSIEQPEQVTELLGQLLLKLDQ
jgi:hypothetical protein